MKLISFNPHSLILPSQNALYVVGKRGTVAVRALNIHVLHEKLKPHLYNGVDEDTLIAAGGDERKVAVRSYLKAMRESGAIRIEATDETPVGKPPSEDGVSNHAGRFSFSLGPQTGCFVLEGRAFISVDGTVPAEPRKEPIHIVFASPEVIWQQLLKAGDRKDGAATCTYYVITPQSYCSGSIPPAELELRTIYAKWLLLNANVSESASFIIVYRLDSNRGSLMRMLDFDYAGRSDFLRLPEKLGMITAADVKQIPLAVATVGHEIAPQSITGFGLKQDHDLHEHLISEFLAAAMLAGCNDSPESFTVEKTFGANRIEARRHKLTPGDFEDKKFQVALSLLDLRASLLECCANICHGDVISHRTVDLLQVEIIHPQVEYLRNVLRLRLPDLPARFAVTNEGLFSYEINGHRYYSFFQTKALRDALLKAVAEMFYQTGTGGIGKAGLSTDFGAFTAKGPLRLLLRQREAELAQRCSGMHLVFQRLSCWGRNVWIGKVDERH